MIYEILFALLSLFYGIYYVCAYIHVNQWNMINNLLKKSYRKPVENILYNNHHFWCRKYTKIL